VKHFTGTPTGVAETAFIGGIIMERSHLVETIDLGIRFAVLGFMLLGGIVALLPA
jgi:hypothetical protein